MCEEPLDKTLKSLFAMPSLKWLFVGGKGGVGKTTTACSIATEMAKHKKNVLIISTDPAHNLSDAFNQKFTSTPTKVANFSNLLAMEVDSSFQSKVEFGLNENEGWQKFLPELLSAFPGADEAISFAEMMQSVQSMNYEVIIFDTAPTGHTVRLLGFPDLLDKALEKVSQLKEQMGGAISMLSSMTKNDDEDLLKKLDSVKAVTMSVKNTFTDPTLTAFVAVCIPEFLSVYETERLVQELAKLSINCAHIVVNQVVFPLQIYEEKPPPQLTDAEISKMDSKAKEHFNWLKKKTDALEEVYLSRRKMQTKYLIDIDELYSPDFHIVCMPLQKEEVRGLAKLSSFSALLLVERPLPIYEA